MEENRLNSLIYTLLGGGQNLGNPRAAVRTLKLVWRSKYKKLPNALSLTFRDLPVPDREISVLLLHCSWGMRAAEVARAMDIPPDWAWRDLRKAKFQMMNLKSYQKKYCELHAKVVYGINHPAFYSYYI